jgi:hypothetical protein
MTTDEVFSGHCLCGELQYEFDQPPIWVGHCHCASCRRNTGSAVATFVGVASSSFRMKHGTRSFYESSRGVRRSFCDHCGTPLAYESTRFPGELHLFIGTLDDPNRFRPAFHVHCSERIPRFEVRDELPRYPGSTTETDHSRSAT